MKVLYIGQVRRTALALHYFTNMVKMGYKVVPFDPDYFFTHNVVERALVRLRRLPTQSRVQRISEELIRIATRNHFDVVFALAENFVTQEVIETIRQKSKNPPVFIYHSHDNNFSKGILCPKNFQQVLNSYDLVFTTKSQNVARYRANGQPNSHYLASAFEPSVHHPISASETRYENKNFPVTFVGTYDQSRIPHLETIGWEKIHIFGDHWRRFKGYREHKERITPRAVYDFEFADITSHSQLSLGLLREEAEDLHTTRTFEIPACGGLQIAPRNEEILSFFKEDEEIICFSSPQELRDKVTYYLSHDWHRNRIAKRGFERVMRDHHTYHDRLREMFAFVERRVKPTVQVTEPLVESVAHEQAIN